MFDGETTVASQPLEPYGGYYPPTLELSQDYVKSYKELSVRVISKGPLGTTALPL